MISPALNGIGSGRGGHKALALFHCCNVTKRVGREWELDWLLGDEATGDDVLGLMRRRTQPEQSGRSDRRGSGRQQQQEEQQEQQQRRST
jgi:hypothetical protein